MPSKKSNSGSRQSDTSRNRQRPDLWFAEALVSVPRYFRLAITGFLSIGVTFVTMPIMGWIASALTTVTQDATFYLDYLFTLNPAVLNTLLFISAATGLVYYVVGWRIYVGTVGERPAATTGLIWYFWIGVVAVLVTSAWMIRGVLSLPS
jgi:hypothetical protein